MSEYLSHPASFRDPSGFVFTWKGKLFRQVNRSYAADYDLLMGSGLYDLLVKKRLLLPHTETEEIIFNKEQWYKTLQPEQLRFITYPYEWCFGQLKDAALLTLSIMKLSVGKGMILKDATPYNIQFADGRPVFIDTLSFEKYDETKPWAAYRQFCQMFLFPLYIDDGQKLLSVYLDGIPVDLTAKFLPLKSWFNLGTLLHVHLQKSVKGESKGNFSKTKLLQLVNHLESILHSLTYKKRHTTWSNYYSETILGEEYLKEKEKIFREFIEPLHVTSALDLGANDGYFSKILAAKTQVIAIDDDGASINKLYADSIRNILPLIVDISNPSPAIGFNNKERASFHERIKCEMVVALAVIHHLVIGKNLSLDMLAAYFSSICAQLIIEWVPREDEKVQQMLSTRKDVFTGYTEENFVMYFGKYFNTAKKAAIPGTKRVLYFLLKK